MEVSVEVVVFGALISTLGCVDICGVNAEGVILGKKHIVRLLKYFVFCLQKSVFFLEFLHLFGGF